jgi:hypothetical protein
MSKDNVIYHYLSMEVEDQVDWLDETATKI